MSLKSEAKAAEQALRNFFRPGTREQAYVATMSKYAGELKATLQMAQMDVTRLSNEVGGAKARAISAETKTEGLEHEIESLRQRIASIELQQQRAKEQQAAEELHRVAIPTFSHVREAHGNMNVSRALAGMTPAQRRGWVIWPVLAGVGLYHRWLDSDDEWITRCGAYIEQYGSQVFFEDLYDLCCLTAFEGNDSMPFTLSVVLPPGVKTVPPVLSKHPVRVSVITRREAPPDGTEYEPIRALSIMLNPLLNGQGIYATDPTKLRDRRESWARVGMVALHNSSAIALASILFLLRDTLRYAADVVANENVNPRNIDGLLGLPKITTRGIPYFVSDSKLSL